MTEALPLVGNVAATLAGIHMIGWPKAYLGHGIPAATDPRTVRFFGYLFTFFAGSNLAFSTLRLSQG